MTDELTKRHHNKTLIVLVFIAIFAGGLVLWQKVIKDYVIPKNFGAVEDGSIYRSGQICARLIKTILTKYNIRVIVALTGDKPKDIDQLAEKQAASELNMKRFTFPLSGNGTGDVNNYINAITTIAESVRQKEPVLVYCTAGAQRTGGVIAIYRLLVEQKDASFVISEMKKYGWTFHKNPELPKYLNENMELIAKTLKQKGIIERVPSPLPKLQLNTN
jgi:protein tyrosine/serine phosphatase